MLMENNALNLSPQDAELLQCIAHGYSYKEAARQLFRSTKTIDRQLSILRTTFGARNNAHLVHLAWERGLFIHHQNK